jgi:hypothetical protein
MPTMKYCVEIVSVWLERDSLILLGHGKKMQEDCPGRARVENLLASILHNDIIQMSLITVMLRE